MLKAYLVVRLVSGLLYRSRLSLGSSQNYNVTQSQRWYAQYFHARAGEILAVKGIKGCGT